MPIDKPPTWAGAEPIGHDIWMAPDVDHPGKPLVWHWCTKVDRWVAASCRNHDIDQTDPLTLSPSLLWPCCNTHGWIREGRWIPA
jgi:hypothetical protein